MSNGTPPLPEFAWDTPISDLVTTIYDLSDELIANPPRLLVQGTRLQLNWQESGAPEPASFSIIDIDFSARPHAPATMVIHQPEPVAAPTIESLTPASAPAGTDLPLDILGTGFDTGVTVEIGSAYGLVPTSVSSTALSVLGRASNIALPGTLALKVANGDRQVSNSLNLTLT